MASQVIQSYTDAYNFNDKPIEKPRPQSAYMNGKRIHREVRFGSYILGSTLGEGEFGKVKLGWRKDGKQPSQVAIKLIKRDTILKDSELEIKIHREINSLKLLNHPNIVNLVEVMKSGKYIGIVLEYASGGELFDYILHHKYLKENVAKKLFAQLVSGVDYMHSKGLIHRDLKLENLLLDKHKNVIISDFGFVNSYNRDKHDLMKTSCGSPCYAAPELVLTQSPYEGKKVDIWSLGVILYAMLSGYLPFDDDPENEDGSDIVKLYHYICKTPLTFPEYVSPLARDLLRKIIVPDPKKRINIDAVRNHPWLSPHANLLSIRQPEWDKIHKESKDKNVVSLPNKNKRFSMVNERTHSSSVVMSNHGRSYSSTNIVYNNPSVATTSSSLANVMALPENETSPVKVTPASNNSASDSSPTKPAFVPGHAKSASVSNSYSPASNALKAVVSENKRNSVSSLDLAITNLSSQPPILSPPKSGYHHLPVHLPRSTTYTGTISTISETPTKPATPKTITAPAKDAARLPHATKKPRPTSYHPSSMTSTLNNQNEVSASALLDYIKIPLPINLPYPQFLSNSPPKVAASDSSSSVDSNSGSPKSGVRSTVTSRRNSVVTHVHVNGVLSSDLNSHENKRNSVLSYLEDRMEGLDLNVKEQEDTEAEPQVNEKTDTPQINQQPMFDDAPSPIVELKSKDIKVPVPESTIQEESEKEVKAKTRSGSKSKPKSEGVSRSASVRTVKDQDKENRKKRNRFSLLSLYSNYNTSNSNVSETYTGPKKVLEPSSEANIVRNDGKKRIQSNSSLTSKRSGNSGSNSSANGKEASAARKVMDFFKRRSIRVG